MQTIVAWVAIAFTIASFVRDYLDITKDRDPSPQESWQLQNDFRLSCEYDRRAGLQSDACDVVLSEPASPPPGIAKRALHERGVPHHLELAYKIPYPHLALMVIATIVLPFAIDKFCGQSRKEQPVICWSKPSSTSIGEQHEAHHEAHTDPSDLPSNQLSRENERLERPGPPSRDKKALTIMICALPVLPIFLIYCLVRYEKLVLDTYESRISTGMVFGSTLVFLTLLSVYTGAKKHEILAAAAAYVPIS